MKRCANCHTPCEAGEIFCAHCGAALQRAGGMVEEEAQSTPSAFEGASPGGEGRPAPIARPRRRTLRRGLAVGLAVCLLAAGAAGAAALLRAPGGTLRAGQFLLRGARMGTGGGAERFYYDGALLAGEEAGLVSSTVFLDGKSCMVIDEEGALRGVLNAEGLNELTLAGEGLNGTARAADGSAMYYTTRSGELWRQSLPTGEARLLLEGVDFSGSLVLSPSGDTAAYEDGEENWYLVEKSGRSEALPLETGAKVIAVSDGGKYVYYSHAVDGGSHYSYQYDSYLSYIQNSLVFCWDGTGSSLIAPTMANILLSNRTGDQLLLVGEETYLVDEGYNRHFSGYVMPVWTYRGLNDVSGICNSTVTVADCDDLTAALFYAADERELCRVEDGGLTPVAEEVREILCDAGGDTVWYLQGGGIWTVRGGSPRQVWKDAGSYAELKGVSPDGETLLYENREGLWRLRRGGAPEQLSEDCQDAMAYWDGFYYATKDRRMFFCPWEGAAEELEELAGYRSMSFTSGASLPEVELADGSRWFLLPGTDPIPAGG